MEKNIFSGKRISWMMFLCCAVMVIAGFFIFRRTGGSGTPWILVGICIIGHITMMFFGHHHGEMENKEKEEKIIHANGEEKNIKHENHGGCCH